MAAREQEAAAAGRTNRPRVLLPGLAVRIAAVGRSLLSDPPRSFWLVFFIFLYFFFLPSNSSPLVLGRILTGVAAALALGALFAAEQPRANLPSRPVPPLTGWLWLR